MTVYDIPTGALYKAFLVTSSTTAELLIRQALDKANMVEDPHNYRVHQAAVAPNGRSLQFYIAMPTKCIHGSDLIMYLAALRLTQLLQSFCTL